ncbi:MAG: PLDc_N domain-containing protein, partial [Ruminococcus sp.]|nr:PLDc_N domain-containing protein [Ruminococcus sp.]
MKKKIIIHDRYGVKEKEIDYIPVRFIIAMLLIILETAAVIGITLLCGAYIPYFYLAMWATEIFCVLKIINSEENPDYKIPWLLVTILIPVAGFMLYFMFYDRKLTKKQVKRIDKLAQQQVHTDDKENFAILEKED